MVHICMQTHKNYNVCSPRCTFVNKTVWQGDMKPWVSHSTKGNLGQMVVDEGVRFDNPRINGSLFKRDHHPGQIFYLNKQMEDVRYSLLRLQTAACYLCCIILSLFSLRLFIVSWTLTAEKPNAERKIQHKAPAQQRGGRRRQQQKQRSTPTQVSGRRFPPKRRAPATPEGSYKEHTLAHSHKRKTHTCTHTHGFTKTYQHCLQKLRLDHQQVCRHHLKSSIVKNGMHSRSSFWASDGTGNLFHDCSFVVYLSEFYSAWGHGFLNVWSF